MEKLQSGAITALRWIRKNLVLCIAITAAIVTSCIVLPDETYLSYFDWKTLTCLFCVLAVVCALKNIQFFYILAKKIVQLFRNARLAILALVYITSVSYTHLRLIAENGVTLAEGDLFSVGLTVSEVDFDLLQNQRKKGFPVPSHPIVPIAIPLKQSDTALTRSVSPSPFLPTDTPEATAQRLERILDLQCSGLAKRLTHTHCKTAVIGLSGGLDSTLALLVTARTYDKLGKKRSEILAISMPCFGTTGRTKSNAQSLAEALGVSFREIPIGKAVAQHFVDIGPVSYTHLDVYKRQAL